MAAAYAALASLMYTIHEIEHHHSPPISLDKQQAQSLTQYIIVLQRFLESYNPPVSDEESADPLEMRIADAAYIAEDVIESHIVDTIQPRPNQTKHTRLFNQNLQQAIEEMESVTIQPRPNQTKHTRLFNQNLQQAIEEMESVTKIAMSIDTEKEVVPAAAAAAAAASSVVASSTFSTGANTFSNGANTAMVGFDDFSLEITDKLTGDPQDLRVIPIVGMGGIGKTTLARNIYERKGIKNHFKECTAWATISQQYNTREILREVYSQVTGTDKNQLSGISEAELGSKLYKCLFCRRFLIVMDDMWSIDAWDEIRHLFPNNRNGSRILVTTRLHSVSLQLNNDKYAIYMRFLNEANSWDLFSKTVFGEESCPRELEKIGKKIVESCRGLPLSILVVGGLLKKTDATERCWEPILSNLTSMVNLENDKHSLRLLRLSYNHLPVHVKPCFLYMGVFEEDARICVSTLYKLWISEGFLNPGNLESLIGSAMFSLVELVDRNLVRMGEMGSIGNLKSCKIHDLLRDLCLKEGKKYGFYHVVGQSRPRGISRQRRVVIPRNASEREILGDLQSMPHARSVICENGIKVPKCRNIGLLRTFHAFYEEEKDKSYEHSLAFQCFNLRHLAIKGRGDVSSFLSSLSLLWNLHTIIISCSHESTTIPEFWKMTQLRHVEFVNNSLCLPDTPSVDRGDDAIIMENLHTLTGVRNFKCCEEVVRRIPNIKKLKTQFNGIMGSNLDEFYGISNMELLCKLESFKITCSPNFRGSRYLHKLTFSHSLTKVCLSMKSDFECEEMMEKMGSLPLLEKFKLWMGCFETGKWEIAEGQFPSLKYLGLFFCYGLEHWVAAEDCENIFPRLQRIELTGLQDLKTIPREIGDIPTLKRLSLTVCSEAAVKCAKDIVDEQGDDLLRVVVELAVEDQGLLSLANPNFEVKFDEDKAPRWKMLYKYILLSNQESKEDETN